MPLTHTAGRPFDDTHPPLRAAADDFRALWFRYPV
jgi:hypothetical protein